MTIEIRQLVIRAVVDPREGAARRPDDDAPARAPDPREHTPSDRDALVAACTREVLRALKKARER
jgi:hypothetical protein